MRPKDADDPRCCPGNPLESSVVVSVAITVPDGDLGGKDAFDGPPVEG